MSEDKNIWYNIPSGCLSSSVGMILALLMCLILSILLAGCRGKELVTERVEVPVVVTQEHHTESIKLDIIRDTLIQRDSVYHYIKGDTTIIEKWHYLQGTTNVARVDTLHIYDSVPYPVTNEKIVTKVEQVEKPLHWWQKLFIGIGGVSLIVLLLMVAHRIGKSKVM